MIASRRSRERDIIVVLIAERLRHPGSKPASVRTWHTTTPAEKPGVGDVDEDAVYRTLDRLVKRRGKIEAKLARKHLAEGKMALYDLSSS